MRTFGSPKTPRTVGSARNPSNEYVSQSRRRRFDGLTIHKWCQILNPAKMQNSPEIPRSVTLQALKSTHSIPRRPHKERGPLAQASDYSATVQFVFQLSTISSENRYPLVPTRPSGSGSCSSSAGCRRSAGCACRHPRDPRSWWRRKCGTPAQARTPNRARRRRLRCREAR